MRQHVPIFAIVLLLASTLLAAGETRDFAAQAGLGPIKEGEVRIWRSQVTCSGGVSLAGDELIQFQPCYRLPSRYELHNRMQWIRSRLPAQQVLEVRKAVGAIVDLNGQHLRCASVLDGWTVLVEARVNGAHLLLQAEDPDQGDSDACRRVHALYSLLWSAARRHAEQDK